MFAVNTLPHSKNTSLFPKSVQMYDTVKTLNTGTPRPATVVVLNIKLFYNEVMPPIDVERMANSVDPVQTVP